MTETKCITANHLMLGTGVSSTKEAGQILSIVKECFARGIFSFDTAPSYRMEEKLGEALHQAMADEGVEREQVFYQTKIDPMQIYECNTTKYLQEALDKSGFSYVDAFLIHWPVPDYVDENWKQMCMLKKAGLVRRIGICNVRMRQLKQMEYWPELPDIVQIERNPLRTCLEEVAFCHEHHIEVQAYSPLCKMDDRLKNSAVLQEISRKYMKSISQVILRWHLDTGVIPIFATTKIGRVDEQSNIFDFVLTDDEIRKINGLNQNYKMYLESMVCPGF